MKYYHRMLGEASRNFLAMSESSIQVNGFLAEMRALPLRIMNLKREILKLEEKQKGLTEMPACLHFEVVR